MPVVHDLVAHIDRRAIPLERPLNDLDCAHNAGTKPAWLCQDDFHRSNTPEPISRLSWNAVKMLLCYLIFAQLLYSAAWLECLY